jgi:hypothetical protein
MNSGLHSRTSGAIVEPIKLIGEKAKRQGGKDLKKSSWLLVAGCWLLGLGLGLGELGAGRLGRLGGWKTWGLRLRYRELGLGTGTGT